jgi:N-acetylmuramoyl-L-alanine amidase
MSSLIACVAMLVVSVFPATGGAQQQNFILLVVPESDTVQTTSPTYRLSAGTNPGNTMTLNGSPLKVHPSGAVAGLLRVEVGENIYTLKAIDKDGIPVEKTFVIVRQKPLETTSPDTLAVEDVMMEPATDMWLNAGDILRLQIKGTPGCTATFFDGLPMREVVTTGGSGLGGIYRATYKVKPADTLSNRPITFRLTHPDGRSITKESPGRISFLAAEFPRVAVTRGERPALAYGLGDDRLGGAKLSFINAGIRLAITGKVGALYRVALTDNQEAWIDTAAAALQPPGTFPPFSLTGSWSVYGDDRFDYVTVALTDRLPYASFQESGPTRIHVDLYGAVSNSNWITQHATKQEIKEVYYRQMGKNHFRITIELKHKQVWGYEVLYQGTTLVVKVRRQPERLRLRSLTFALDAGHGGANRGALGSTGAMEKDVTLAIVGQLKDILERKGSKVVLTRADDSNILNSDRLKSVLASDADMLISVHANSIGLTTNPEDTRGVSTYYKHICYRPLSVFILNHLLKTGLVSFGNVGSFNFALNGPTELPNVLVETAFISNPEDEMLLLDPRFQRELAQRIVDGVEEFLEYCND